MAFDPNEARDPHGRWTRGGESDLLPRNVVDPRAMEVGGDEWNRQTAQRLETEYAAVRPDIDRIAQDAVDQEVEVGGAPGSWDDTSGGVQEEAASKYYAQNYDSNYDSEVESWHDGGEALNEAKHNLADDGDWKEEQIADFLADQEDAEHPIPYTAQQLSDAIEIRAADDSADEPDITFNDDFLSEPSDLDPNWNENQPTLPGIGVENASNSAHLTEKMRADIIAALTKEFNKEAEKKSSYVDVPDYVSESAKEYTQSQWEEMSDEDKYSWTKDNTQLLEDEDGNDNAAVTVAMPEKFDPLNETSGEDYRRTQALAKYISDHRAAQLITDRIGNKKWKPRSEFLGSDADYEKLYGPGGVGAKKDEAWTERMLESVQSIDSQLWSGWKGSSTGMEGKILQVAAADELGGRLRENKKPGNTAPDDAPEPDIVSMAKAVVGDSKSSYTKTQYAKSLIKAYSKDAPMEVLKAYHAVLIGYDPMGPTGQPTPAFDSPEMKAQNEAHKIVADYEIDQQKLAEAKETPIMKSEAVDGFIRLPDVNIQRNGAASTTISRDVANGWSGTTNYAPSGIDRKEVIDTANQEFKNIGGYDGVKAAVRAKWETTQYLLDRADIPVVQAYRGITMPHNLGETVVEGDFNPPYTGKQKTKYGDEIDLKEKQIGAKVETQSGKIIEKISNEDSPSGHAPGAGTWKYSQTRPNGANRIVMRAEVPRTAVISVPAYGVNVKSEQEVVVVGTAWRDWDAWSERAPSFAQVPLHAKKQEDKTAALENHRLETAKADAKETADLDALYAEMKQKKAA